MTLRAVLLATVLLGMPACKAETPKCSDVKDEVVKLLWENGRKRILLRALRNELTSAWEQIFTDKKNRENFTIYAIRMESYDEVTGIRICLAQYGNDQVSADVKYSLQPFEDAPGQTLVNITIQY